MLSFLLDKQLTDKERMLDCIKKVHDWQSNNSYKEPSQSSFKDSPQASTVTAKDLKLELSLSFMGQEAITTVEELDAYLARSMKLSTPKS